MKNHLPDPVEVFYKDDTKVHSCGIAKPGELFNVPLHAVYTPNGEFFFKPLNRGWVWITKPIGTPAICYYFALAAIFMPPVWMIRVILFLFNL